MYGLKIKIECHVEKETFAQMSYLKFTHANSSSFAWTTVNYKHYSYQHLVLPLLFKMEREGQAVLVLLLYI